MKQQIRRAMSDPDGRVLLFHYIDRKGNITQRVVSPIRFMTPNRFLALCLGREEPRMFYLDRMSNVELANAHQFLMPVPIVAVTNTVESGCNDPAVPC